MAEVIIKIKDTDKSGDVELSMEFKPEIDFMKINSGEIKTTPAQNFGILLLDKMKDLICSLE